MRIRPTWLRVGVCTLLLAVMGCSGELSGTSERSGDDTAFQDGGSAPQPSISPEDTVRALIEARATGDGAPACSLYTDSFAAEELLESDEDAAPSCAQALTLEGPEDYFQDEVVRVVMTDAAPGYAEVGVTYDSNPGIASYSLEQVQGAWKLDSVSTD